MRTAFIETLCELAARDERVWLLTGDLGFSVLERFRDRLPERFLNVGVAEQNLTGVAAGLAHAGKIVFTYSIANFPVLRCLEQIRNDVCYHALPVKIVAVGGGLAYASAGYSHQGLEDLAVMRVLPHMTVLAPADPHEARAATEALAALPGPAYLRLGKAGEPILHSEPPAFAVGKVLPVRSGSDLTLVSTGAILGATLQAADLLAKRGITASVLSSPSLAPFDASAILREAERTGTLLTVEEHGEGGLGSIAAEVLAQAGRPVRFRTLRLDRVPFTVAGSQESLRAAAGLSPEAITQRALALLGTRTG